MKMDFQSMMELIGTKVRSFGHQALYVLTCFDFFEGVGHLKMPKIINVLKTVK